ncbi:MAG: ATP-binding protein [Cyclobacteriaceae bacterium]
MAIEFVSSLKTLNRELKWLNQMIEYRFSDYFQQSTDVPYPDAPDLSHDTSFYASTLRELALDDVARLLILIALAPHLRPAVFDIFFTKNSQIDRSYAEFGGLKGEKHSGFVPTGETATFIIAGNDLDKRFQIQRCFDDQHILNKENILSLGFTNAHEPIWSGELIISKEFLTHVTLNEPHKPRFSPTFPAQLLTSKLEWDDVVFDNEVLTEIEHLQSWISHEERIMKEWKLEKFLSKGYRALFYGPPGTGKSMTAAMIGKTQNMDVYRIDLSSVVSKYIGETEKNLSNLFNMAENKRWILFFDEADALFGKRLSTQSSNDMFANQQVAFLLQRIEDFNGLVILASNFKDNIDEAFLRRFQSVIYFPKPNAALRLELWEKYFSRFDLSKVNMEKIAANYEISGGSIINVLRYCSIASARRKSTIILEKDIIKGIKKEFTKDGVTL